MPNPTPNTPDLDAIAARLAKITPGKWHVNHGDDRLCMNTFYVATTITDDDPCEVYEDVVCVTLYQAERCASHRAYRWEEDAEFIAHAPADIAALLAEVERLRKFEAFHEGLKELAGFSGYDMLDAESLADDINYAHSYR